MRSAVRRSWRRRSSGNAEASGRAAASRAPFFADLRLSALTEASMASDRTSAATRLLTRPLYLQVRDALIERIGKGEWRPGAAIPNEVDLAREFGISSGTMRKALDQLEGERAITRKQGRGTYVADQSSDLHRFSRISGADGKPLAAESRTVEIFEVAANEAECRRLCLGPYDQIYRVRSV